MPRKERKPAGTASGNRSDRNNAAVQGTDPGPQDQYGERTAMRRQLEQQPLPDEAAAWQQALEQARGLGGEPLLAGPSQRPGEPVTAGLPIGAGAGPEAIERPQQGPTPEIMAAAQWLPIMEAKAASPTSSATFRQYVRYLRSQLPPDFNPAQIMGG